MTFLALPFVILFYMWGGQTMKWIRPVGVALSLFGAALLGYLKEFYFFLPGLAYGFELAFGYGEKSIFSRIDNHNDEETRILYALWCCPPVIAECIIAHFWWPLIGCAFILGAYQIRAGAASFKVFGKDFLYEDLARSLAIGFANCWGLGMVQVTLALKGVH